MFPTVAAFNIFQKSMDSSFLTTLMFSVAVIVAIPMGVVFFMFLL